MVFESNRRSSAWKSSPKTGKRLRLDWTKTAQGRKFAGPSKIATATSLTGLNRSLAELVTKQNS
ncbi:hypothetical protein K443DRAFT_14694 [Laccaria amethystina LaAM-08-1]|uniref:Uncharacterized protein n=1 Tax=Laccaria amethystina LaAM-08-1 TaxID=1095629 RepID=A0A0C9WSP0_9AGAR|nr:hypothetical protein K443DRAFT_14694 [Laccaria amethystina LaAM-08-1]